MNFIENIEDLLPISIQEVLDKRDKIYNIPNSDREKIKKDLELVNNDILPKTLRVYKFNHLPFCIVKIILDGQSLSTS